MKNIKGPSLESSIEMPQNENTEENMLIHDNSVSIDCTRKLSQVSE
jgi:hypothetical protein